MRYAQASSQRTILPDVDALKPTGAMTISAWVKKGELTGTTEGVIACQSGTTASYRLQFANSLLPNYSHQDGASTYTLTSTMPVPKNAWVHLAVTRDASYNCTLYMNGNVVASGSTAIVPTAPTIAPCIGSVNSGFAYFNGFIDDVRLYNRVLSPDEIKTLAQRGNVSRSGLLGEWLFNEGELNGTSLPQDTSGNGQHATTNNGTFAWQPIAESRILKKASRGSAAYNGSTSTATITTGTVYTKLLGASAITVGGWFLVRRGLGATQYLFGVPTSTPASGAMLYLTNTNVLQFASRSLAADSGSTTSTYSGNVIGNWNHFVGVVNYASASMQLYVNGRLFDEVTGLTFGQATYAGGDATCAVGSLGNGSGWSDVCTKDLVMYARGLTADEVYDLYLGNTPKGAVVNLPCNDGYSTTLTDISGNGYNYTNNTAAAFSLNSPY